MDGDPAVEPALDTFSLILPLPYRVAAIVTLAVWAWGANLHYLSAFKIDVPSLIRYPNRTSPIQPAHHLSTYRLAALLSIGLTANLLLFWLLTRRDPTLVIAYDWLPITYLALFALSFCIPLQSVSQAGRYRTLAILKRVSVGGIAQAKDGKFGDVLLADVLTSYAKVLGDLFVSLCMFFSQGGSATKVPDRNCGGEFLVPLILSIPSLIRLRQCIIEYLRVREDLRGSGRMQQQHSGWGGQHLANALKYASAFPVIILSALQRKMSLDHESVGLSSTGLYRAWLAAVMVNSFYSFWWDIMKDWDLTLFSTKRDNVGQHYGLRRTLTFRNPNLYYFAMGLDFVLRCTWSLKLSPHLDHFNDLEGGIFMMELAEVFRRWVWIFLRVETEWVREQNKGGPAGDDVLLGNYDNGKGDMDEEFEDEEDGDRLLSF